MTPLDQDLVFDFDKPTDDQSELLDHADPYTVKPRPNAALVGPEWDYEDIVEKWETLRESDSSLTPDPYPFPLTEPNTPHVQLDTPPQMFNSTTPRASSPPRSSHDLARSEAGPARPIIAPDLQSPSPQPLRRSSRRATRQQRTYREVDSDQESEGAGTEDEYVPSPILKPMKRHDTFFDTYSRTRADPYPTALSSRTPPSLAVPTPKERRRRRSKDAPGVENIYLCDHPGCNFEQKNRRMVDLRRHKRTHLRRTKWICCGLPRPEVERRGLKVTGFIEVFVNGVSHIGGCKKTYARKDSLRRHITKKTGSRCVGDPENLDKFEIEVK